MKKTIFLILILFSIILTGCSKGSNQNSAIKTSAEVNLDKSAKTSESQINSVSSANTEGNASKTQFEYINNLKEMEVANLNVSNNINTILKLPTSWHANKSIYKTADSFEFNELKNKGIKKLYSYEIFDDKNSNIGMFEFLGNSNEPIGGGLPNHSLVKKVIYEGETKLGKGLIYLLECDLPKEQITDKYSTYEQIYSIISIENEILAYNVSINVPLGENEAKYIEIVKKMLIENQR